MGSKVAVLVSRKKVWRVQALTEALRLAHRSLAEDLKALEEALRAQEEAEEALAAVQNDQKVSDMVLALRRWEKAATAGRHVVFRSRGAVVRPGRASR